MNNEEQQEYQERMGGPEMEYLQWLSENPEVQAYKKGQEQKKLYNRVLNKNRRG